MANAGRKGWVGTLASEYVYFFKRYKMWWLLPIVVMMTLLAGLVLLSGTQAAVFIYALF